MKQLLIILSTFTTLTLASNNNIIGTIIKIDNNTNDKKTNKSIINETPTSLFNNHYQYLSNDNWITNQSTIDHKFYSYDTSFLEKYTFDNAKNTFLVDTTGNLVFNPKVIVPNKDKLNIKNTKQEMINNHKVTTIKDDYNPYSKSEYSKLYFNGDNSNNWQYIQQGSVEKHIDISQQFAGNKVEYSNNLSENLGLYYIAKAARENKITQTVAANLAIYFISQSSLKEQISENLTTKILELIIHNENVYNFIYNINISVNDKNYSLNYIFNNDNQLVTIYYHKWNNTNNVTNDKINYSFWDWYNGISITTDNSNIYNILKWKDYAADWNTFTKIYPTFTFINSHLTVTTSTGIKNSPTLSANTRKITEDKSTLFVAYINTKNGTNFGTEISLTLSLWHDKNNIYFQWYCSLNSAFGQMTYVSIKINNISFYNIMNN